jgi:flagellar biosynthesis/type III secretory pathway protein FliH
MSTTTPDGLYGDAGGPDLHTNCVAQSTVDALLDKLYEAILAKDAAEADIALAYENGVNDGYGDGFSEGYGAGYGDGQEAL